MLVLTYNRTLRGYIAALVEQQLSNTPDVSIQVSTFSKWARTVLGNPTIISQYRRRDIIIRSASGISLPRDFLLDEIEYLMGRYLPGDRSTYTTTQRTGRGALPRVDRALRKSILDDVVIPYQNQIDKEQLWDWNDLAVKLALEKLDHLYDIVIADETQDFSANQIRAINNQLTPVHSLTLIVDTAQRIYARGFTWQEVGLTIRPENSRRLLRNYRNTLEIAHFASSILNGLPADDDATIPDFNQCTRHGPKPIILRGKFALQTSYVIDYLLNQISLTNESVAILHPLGGDWQNYLRSRLIQAGLRFVEIARESEWPAGDENIALSTIHSAKGLEFDHVTMIGLNAEVLTHGKEPEDDALLKLRRLLAMGISRARVSVLLGYSPDDVSQLFQYFDANTYDAVNL